MNIVFFTHPLFFQSRSMLQYTRILAEGMKARNHRVQILAPKPIFAKLGFCRSGTKWFGYIDQYLVFPIQVKNIIRKYSKDTLFVFIDQALGIWVPLVSNRPHVVHCHDFLALQSAIGGNYLRKISWTGKIYQQMIRDGFSKGKNFISISQKTQNDLHKFHSNGSIKSHVVYNQVSQVFKPGNKNKAYTYLRIQFKQRNTRFLSEGYILHVGANLWYKNKKGVLEIYNAWRLNYNRRLPLVMVGQPDVGLKKWIENRFWRDDFYLLENVTEELLVDLYNGASAFLFPSFAEGFGWPIAEAMACKCPVITTNEAPMTEVGGQAAFYIPRRPESEQNAVSWARSCAMILEEVLTKEKQELEKFLKLGSLQVEKFKASDFLDQTEEIYEQIVMSNQ